MKEAYLTLTEKKEFIFEKPEPYITIHIANKETYEKLADVIEKDTPAEVEAVAITNLTAENKYHVFCPQCGKSLGSGATPEKAFVHIGRYCRYCGQAIEREEQLYETT